MYHKNTILTLALFFLVLPAVSAVECGTTPTNGCTISVDTTFNTGTYYLNGSGGLVININNSNVILDGNGSIIQYGCNEDGTLGIYNLEENNNKIRNFTLVQCNSSHSGYAGIRIANSTNITVEDINIITLGNISVGIFNSYVNSSLFTKNNISTTGDKDSIGIYCESECYNNSASYNTIKTTGNSSYGIHFQQNGWGNVFTQNIINTSGYGGIGIFNELDIHNFEISNNTIYIYGNRSDGIRLDANITHGVIRNNTIYVYSQTNSNGIYLLSDTPHPSYNLKTVSNNQMSQNYIYTNGNQNICFYLTSNNTKNNFILDNLCYTYGANSYGIYLYNLPSGNYIGGNIVNTTGSSSNGISLALDVTNNTINNSISLTSGASARGIRLDTRVTNNYFYDTNVTTYSSSNGHGVYLITSSTDNYFNNLNIVSNTHAIYSASTNQSIFLTGSNVSCSGLNCYNILFDAPVIGGKLNISNTLFSNIRIYSSGLMDIFNLNGKYNLQNLQQGDFVYGSNSLNIKNTNLTSSKVQNLNSLTNALLYSLNGSTHCGGIVTGSCNIIIQPNNESYVLDNYNLTIGNSRTNGFYDGSLFNLTLTDAITFDVYGTSKPVISNGVVSSGSSLSDNQFTISGGSYFYVS